MKKNYVEKVLAEVRALSLSLSLSLVKEAG
jgi:hypothetical protein